MTATRRDFLRTTALATASSVVAPALGGPFAKVFAAQAAEAIPVGSGGALGALGNVVDYLIDPDDGLERRLAFNRDPEPLRQVLAGNEMASFLTFERGQISQKVLENVAEAGFTPADVEVYATWLRRTSAWNFAADEEERHRIGLQPAGASVQYSWPKCQVYKVVVAPASGGQTLQVYAQGLLAGATIRLVDDASNASVQEWVMAEPDPGSTFRYGRTTREVQLMPGTYRAVVINSLGDGAQFAIDSPAATFELG